MGGLCDHTLGQMCLAGFGAEGLGELTAWVLRDTAGNLGEGVWSLLSYDGLHVDRGSREAPLCLHS